MSAFQPLAAGAPKVDLYFDVCDSLIVRTDHGHTPGDYKNIACCECRALRDGRPCHRNGRCIEARDALSGRITKKTFPAVLSTVEKGGAK